jgi:Dickkopf N-terminal cysteine-rich region
MVALAMVCSCVGGDDGDPSKYVSLTGIPAAYQAAICTHLVACHEMPDQATCLASTVGSYYIDPVLIQTAVIGEIRYDGSTLFKCFDNIATASCNPGDLSNRESVDQCALYIFSGTVRGGSACTSNIECVSQQCGSGTACNGQSGCCNDACVGDVAPSQIPPALGSACAQATFGFDSCAETQYCDEVTNVCTVLKAKGINCQSTSECADGLVCDVQNTLACVVSPQLGDPCPLGQCGELGTYCEPGDDICRAVGSIGDSCAAGHLCSPYLVCDATTMTCQLYPQTGQSCEILQKCNDLDTYCDISTETCLARVADNEACDASYRCISEFCDTTTMRCKEQPICE